MTDELDRLKRDRDRIDAQIELIESGIKKATYDAHMNLQLVTINEARIEQGKPPLSFSQFTSGLFGEQP